jgi:hypothetical protein
MMDGWLIALVMRVGRRNGRDKRKSGWVFGGEAATKTWEGKTPVEPEYPANVE